MRRKPLIWFVLSLACLQAVPAVAQNGAQQVQQRLNNVINGPNYQQATWAMLVIDSKTGEVVFEHNADRMVLPASVDDGPVNDVIARSGPIVTSPPRKVLFDSDVSTSWLSASTLTKTK